ncbi:MAG: hypothetical protein WCY59_02735 [Anaerovoracaceae bacterium]|jgi:hypothetical protein
MFGCLSQETIEAARLAVRLMFEGAKWREAIEKAVAASASSSSSQRVIHENEVAAAIEVMC